MNIISKQQDLYGTDIYRLEDVSKPFAYRATTEHTVQPNANKSNNMVTIRTAVPVVVDTLGVPSAPNTFSMVTKFAALQQITNQTERALAFDEHMAFLEAARSDILEGRLPTAAYTLV